MGAQFIFNGMVAFIFAANPAAAYLSRDPVDRILLENGAIVKVYASTIGPEGWGGMLDEESISQAEYLEQAVWKSCLTKQLTVLTNALPSLTEEERRYINLPEIEVHLVREHLKPGQPFRVTADPVPKDSLKKKDQEPGPAHFNVFRSRDNIHFKVTLTEEKCGFTTPLGIKTQIDKRKASDMPWQELMLHERDERARLQAEEAKKPRDQQIQDVAKAENDRKAVQAALADELKRLGKGLSQGASTGQTGSQTQ